MPITIRDLLEVDCHVTRFDVVVRQRETMRLIREYRIGTNAYAPKYLEPEKKLQVGDLYCISENPHHEVVVINNTINNCMVYKPGLNKDTSHYILFEAIPKEILDLQIDSLGSWDSYDDWGETRKYNFECLVDQWHGVTGEVEIVETQKLFEEDTKNDQPHQ